MVFFLSEVAGQKLPGKWQATACPARVSRNTGGSVTQRSFLYGQRV
jgi:hypothetical protein